MEGKFSSWSSFKSGEDSPDRCDATEEIQHFERMAARAVEEIQSIPDFFYGDRILLSAVLQNQLLQVQKGPLMGNFLADLDECLPGIFRCELGAIGALTVLDEVLDLEGLFQDRVRQNLYVFLDSARCGGYGATHFFLNRHRHPEPLGMRLGPDEVGLR